MVARATSAAPAYLREVEIEGRQFIDGAIGFNNPSEELHGEVEYVYGETANALILSIGTGLHGPPGSSGFGNTLGLVATALRMVTDCQAIHEKIASRSQREKFDYYRFNVGNGMGNIKLGAYKTIPRIKELTMDYLSQQGTLDDLRKAAESLVKNRRDRIKQNRDRWEAFCCDTRYRCECGPHKRCQYGYHERARHRFVEHLKRDHGIDNDDEIKRLIEESKVGRKPAAFRSR
jgi:hypothetical protein